MPAPPEATTDGRAEAEGGIVAPMQPAYYESYIGPANPLQAIPLDTIAEYLRVTGQLERLQGFALARRVDAAQAEICDRGQAA